MKTTVQKLQDLDDATFEALAKYARQHGRFFKRHLADDFARAGSRTFDGDWSRLQALRNTPEYSLSFVNSLTYSMLSEEAARRSSRSGRCQEGQ